MTGGRPARYVAGLPEPDRALVMGVLNVTPDSFSDGGLWLDADRAVEHGHRMCHEGADLVDVGGESTRPGAVRAGVAEELERVLPVVSALASAGIRVSVDTMRAEVAAAAVAAGAVLVNDVSGGRADPEMLPAVADSGAAYVLMHWRAHSQQMQQLTRYRDVVGDVAAELEEQLSRAVSAGIASDRIALDPGIGFSKTPTQNWELLAGLEALHALAQPLLIGTSRKSFLGTLLPGDDGSPRPAAEREDATTATTALAARAGAWCVRVHTVPPAADAVRVARAWAGSPDRVQARAGTSRDRLTVTGIEAVGRHGVLEHERRDGQTFGVDVTLELDTTAAAVGDDLARTVDYADVATRVRNVIEGEPVDLVETLAQRIADVCLSWEQVHGAEVTVHKPFAPIPVTFSDVTLTIRRTRP